MLTISPINNISYYYNLAKEDYFLGSGEPLGVWRGLGTRYLGICDKIIEDSDYQQLMRGFAPSGEALVQNAGDEQKRRNGWDCTFSAPKSVSLIWASGDSKLRQQIKTAQERAVCQAIQFIERKAAITRRGKAGKRYERTAGLVVATFDHSTNREQQPQLHTHALICNAAPRMDGGWGSLDSRKIYQWQKASGAIYRAELAYQLRALGFKLERDEDSFHVMGIDKNLCRAYSKRAQDIEKALEASGLKTSASKSGQRAKLRTRKHKQAVNHQELLTQWQTELKNQELTPETIDKIQKMENVEAKKEIDSELIIDEITDSKAIFTEQEIYRRVAVEAVLANKSAREAEKIARQALCAENIIALQPEESFSHRYTTQEVIETERLMVQTAKDLANRFTKCMGKEARFDAIKSAEEELEFKFDDEQKEAILGMLNGGDFNVTQGSSGAGKTTTLLPVKLAYEATGLRIEGACIAKRAADNLTKETGIKSHTVASIIKVIENGENPLTRIDALVVDEAGQLPSTYLQQLLHAAKGAHCKLILTGEDKQLDGIQRGGALRYLSRPEVIGTQRIENIRRQRKEWARTTVARLRDGESRAALKAMKDHTCLHWGENSEDAKQKLIDDWHQYQKENPDKKSLVMAQKWTDVKLISEKIRSIYIEEGKVGKENVPLTCSVADKKFEYEFSVGDRIKFCRNEYQNLKVTNGTLGTIKEIDVLEEDVRLTVEIDDKRRLSFLASEYRDELGANICLAYALTVYSAQGITIDGNTFTLYNGGMDRANSYVSLSRHKDEAHIYVNRSEIDERAGAYDQGKVLTDFQRMNTLEKLMCRDNYSSLAIEHLPEQQIAVEKITELEMTH